MALGDRINEIRKEKKISIDELCERSGVPKGTLSKITAGITANPTLDTVRVIAQALGCTLDDLDDSPSYKLDITVAERTHIQKYRRLTDNGRATVDNVIDSLLEAGQPACEQEQKEPEKIFVPVAARGGTGEPLEISPDTARLLEETKEWRREQIKNSDVF